MWKKEPKKSAAPAAFVAGVASAAAVAAAGYYLYASKDAEGNRAAVMEWASQMREDIAEEVEKVKDIDRKQILAIIDTVSERFVSMKGMAQKDVARASKDLKSRWREFVREGAALIE